MLENKNFLGGDKFRKFAAAAGLTVAFTVAAMPSVASDATGSFTACSNNAAASVAIAEAQMSVEVSNIGGGQVRFDLSNTGANASSITDVYFDDNNSRLTSISLVDADDGVGGDPGVDFSIGAAPPDLPSGNTCSPAFSVSAGLLADADSPSPVKGVNPGEELGVIFNLAIGTFSDILDDLESGALRVGIHVQAFANGESESLVSEFTRNMNEVAEPGTFALFGIGLVGLGYARRRRSTAPMTEWRNDNA